MIVATPVFKDNLQQLPAIDGIQRIDLHNEQGEVIASIPNEAGKQGSLAVYHYLAQNFASLGAAAAAHGLEIFGEHTADAKNRPGAHPNIDRLLDIINGSGTLTVVAITA